MLLVDGFVRKMNISLDNNNRAQYRWCSDKGVDTTLLNDFLGKPIALHFRDKIKCIHCERVITKSFSQGHCYPCFKKLARCDLCFFRPHTCHHHQGTCREPKWGEDTCMREHIVYLANTSGLKVGLTRYNHMPIRWLDQGAVSALPIFTTKNRLCAGLIEELCKQSVADVTNWRVMLRSKGEAIDLIAERDKLLVVIEDGLADLCRDYAKDVMPPYTFIDQSFATDPSDADSPEVLTIDYPILEYPTTIRSHNLDKTHDVAGVLNGIKGQYLMIGDGVINIRKYSGYGVDLEL